MGSFSPMQYCAVLCRTGPQAAVNIDKMVTGHGQPGTAGAIRRRISSGRLAAFSSRSSVQNAAAFSSSVAALPDSDSRQADQA